MNKTIYKSFGILLMILTFAFIVLSFFNQITHMNALLSGWTQSEYLYEVVVRGVYPSIFVFIFGFFPGLFFYRFGNEINESNKFVKSALILQIVSLIIVLFLYVFFTLPCNKEGCDSLGLIGPYFIFGIPALIIYGIGVLFMVIYKYKTNNFKLRSLEKIILSILVLIMIFVFVIYKIGA